MRLFAKCTLSEMQVHHETLTSTIEKLETEINAAKKILFSMRDKGERMHNMYAKLERAQADMDQNLKRVSMEEQAILNEIAATDKLHMRANNENMSVEDKMVAVLGDQTTTEKGAAGTATHIQKKRKAVRLLQQPSVRHTGNCFWL